MIEFTGGEWYHAVNELPVSQIINIKLLNRLSSAHGKTYKQRMNILINRFTLEYRLEQLKVRDKQRQQRMHGEQKFDDVKYLRLYFSYATQLGDDKITAHGQGYK